MRSVTKVLALLLVLGAPFASPSLLMSQALAQEALSPELQQALATALQGTPEQVEVQLQALLDANPGQKSQILAQARTLASGNVLTAVNNVGSRQSIANATQNQNNNQGNSNPFLTNSGLYVYFGENNQPFALNPLTEAQLQQAWIISDLQIPFLRPLDTNIWWANLGFESCLSRW